MTNDLSKQNLEKTKWLPPKLDTPNPAAVAKGGVMKILRPILALLGVFFIVIGVPIAFLTPIPFVPIGLPIVILGVVLLARNSLTGKRWMRNVIAKHPSLKRFAPNWLLHLILGDEAQTLK
ncbi:hypothetical protein [Hirschia litorea]|uniref:Transmembrane protein (PGPGW) n=1 Tax=Hirschia litorea TaxID=1199156 RepID=A0ABW2IJN2_9PROT